MNRIMTAKFDNYVCEGDTIELEKDGYTFTARIERDTYYHIDDDDVHNPDQSVTGCNDEQFQKLLKARKAWFNNEWFYCGIVLSVSFNGIMLDEYASSLWGIEANYPGTDNSYLTGVANELLPDALEVGKAARAEMLKKLK